MRLIVSLLLAAVMAACTSSDKNSQEAKIYDIDLDSVDMDSVPLSAFVDSIKYIPLENSDVSRIGNIKDIVFNDSLIVILDDISQQILAFDRNGNFRRIIGSKGNGPGEYIRATHLNSAGDKFLVYDYLGGAVLVYDSNGDFLKSETVEGADDVAVLSGKDSRKYLFTRYDAPRSEAGIFLKSASESKAERLLENRDGIERTHAWDIFKNGGDISVMTSDYENRVLKWNGDSLVCELDLRITPAPTESEIRNWQRPDIVKHYNRMAFFNADRWFLANYWKEDNQRFILIDKSSGKSTVTKNLYNDIDSVSPVNMLPVTLDGNFVFASSGDTEEDNPRLQILYLKK